MIAIRSPRISALQNTEPWTTVVVLGVAVVVVVVAVVVVVVAVIVVVVVVVIKCRWLGRCFVAATVRSSPVAVSSVSLLRLITQQKSRSCGLVPLVCDDVLM